MADRNRGWQIVIVHIALSLIATLAMIGVHLSTEGEGGSLRHPIRFVLTAALCWCLYRGSPFARWIAIVVFGLAGLLGLVNLLSGGLAALVIGVGSAVYLSFAVVVATSADAKAFFREQHGQVAAA